LAVLFILVCAAETKRLLVFVPFVWEEREGEGELVNFA
jgi:hypothetical protein